MDLVEPRVESLRHTTVWLFSEYKKNEQDKIKAFADLPPSSASVTFIIRILESPRPFRDRISMLDALSKRVCRAAPHAATSIEGRYYELDSTIQLERTQLKAG